MKFNSIKKIFKHSEEIPISNPMEPFSKKSKTGENDTLFSLLPPFLLEDISEEYRKIHSIELYLTANKLKKECGGKKSERSNICKIMKESADLGYSRAMFKYSEYAFRGFGMKKSRKIAKEYALKTVNCANRTHPEKWELLVLIGIDYFDDDYGTFLKLIKICAGLDNAFGLFNLGLHYEVRSSHHIKDCNMYYKYYKKAAECYEKVIDLKRSIDAGCNYHFKDSKENAYIRMAALYEEDILKCKVHIDKSQCQTCKGQIY